MAKPRVTLTLDLTEGQARYLMDLMAQSPPDWSPWEEAEDSRGMREAVFTVIYTYFYRQLPNGLSGREDIT